MRIHSDVDFASKLGSIDSQRDDDEAGTCFASPASDTRAEFGMSAEPDAAAMRCCKGGASEIASLAGEDGDEDEDDCGTRWEMEAS